MRLHTLKFAEGSVKTRKRVGRGQGSGAGETAGRGVKGAGSRSGFKVRSWFEGGQMPIYRRLPKYGFINRFRTEYEVVNLLEIARLKDRIEGELTPEVMKRLGLIRKSDSLVKILGKGEVDFSVELTAHAISESAKSKVEAAGGKVTLL